VPRHQPYDVLSRKHPLFQEVLRLQLEPIRDPERRATTAATKNPAASRRETRPPACARTPTGRTGDPDGDAPRPYLLSFGVCSKCHVAAASPADSPSPFPCARPSAQHRARPRAYSNVRLSPARRQSQRQTNCRSHPLKPGERAHTLAHNRCPHRVRRQRRRFHTISAREPRIRPHHPRLPQKSAGRPKCLRNLALSSRIRS
jgi:hypothetical protein